MSDSQTSAPSKAPKVRNFETIEGKDLTHNEKESLSRKILLRWLKAKKYEKLKGFQKEMIEATYSEREELKKKIYENTMKELESHKTYSKEERERLSHRFADEILGVADGGANVKIVLKRYQRLQEDVKTFNTVLDTFVRKGQKAEIMAKLTKKDEFKQVINILSKDNPIVAKRIQQHVRDGNYKKMKEEIVRASKSFPVSLSPDQVDQIVAGIIMGNAGNKKFIGIKSVDGLINWLDKARNVGDSFVLSKAGKDLDIPFLMTVRLSKFTLGQLQQKNRIMQRHKHLIENKQNKTSHEQEKLVFINGLDKITQHIEKKIESQQLNDRFKKSLKNYLDKQKDLSPADKAAITAEAKIEDLRVLHLFKLIYGNDQQRENIWGYSLSRAPKMWKAFKTIFLEERKMRKALRKYHVNRLSEWAENTFAKNKNKWKLTGIAEGIGNLEKRLVGVNNQIDDLDDLRSRAKAGKTTKATEKALGDAMIEHDKIYRDYQKMVQQASRIMTKQAKDLIGVGRHLQTMQAHGAGKFHTTNISSLPNISDDSLKKLFGDTADLGKIRANKTGGDLVRAYTNQLVDIKTMQDVTRSRFAAVANIIEETVGDSFSKQFGKVVDQTGTMTHRKMVEGTLKKIESSTTGSGRAKWAAKTLGLPAIIIGIQGYNVMTGKTQSRAALYDIAEAGMGFVPFLGTAMDIRGVIKGTSLSGKKLSTNERWMYAGFAAFGALADVATVFGGLGLGMRAGLGGMRTARKSVKAGAALADAGKMGGFASDVKHAAYASDLPWAQRQIGKVHGALNSVQRADRSADALFTAKANEQAALIGKLGKHQDSLKSLKGKKLDEISDPKLFDEAIMEARRAGNLDAVDSLQKLKKLTNSTGMGINYLAIANKAGKAIEVPTNFFGRVYFKTKGAFLRVKSWLMSIGVPADTIKQYEQSFDAVQTAKRSRIKSVEDLKNLHLEKGEDLVKYQKAYRELYDSGSVLGGVRKQQAGLIDDVRKLRRETEGSKGKLASLKKRFDQVERLKKKGKATPDELKDAKAALTKGEKALNDAKKNLSTKQGEQLTHQGKLGANDKAWTNELKSVDDNLWGIEGDMMKHQDTIRSANEASHFANTKRSMMELEMMNRANNFARRGDALSTTASYLQKGGMVMGAVWMFSGFQMGPAEQIRNAGKVVKPVAGGVGWAGKQLFIEDHSGKPPLDVMVANRMSHIKYRRELENAMTKEVSEKGTQTAVYLARHWKDAAAQDLAKKYNCFDQAQDLVQRGEVKVKGQFLGGARQKAKKAKTKAGAAVSSATGKVKTAVGNVSERISNRSE